jgi:hypothetical protein
MKCSAGVAVTAVLVLLASALTMLGPIAMVFAYHSMDFTSAAPNTQPLPPGFNPDSLRYFGYGACAFFLALGALGAASGVGLLRLWRWARYSVITFGGSLIVFGVMSVLFVLLIPLPGLEKDARIMTEVRAGLSFFYSLWIVVGLWFVLLFTRKKIAEQFRNANSVSIPSLRPVSITVIAWFMLFGSLSIPLCILMHYPAVLLGLIFTGTGASAVYIGYALIYLAIGIGLLRFKPVALWASVVFFAIGALNALILMLPGPKARYLQVMSRFAPSATGGPNPLLSSGAFFPFVMIVGAITVGIPLYFLLTRRKRFFEAAARVNSSSSQMPLPPGTLA